MAASADQVQSLKLMARVYLEQAQHPLRDPRDFTPEAIALAKQIQKGK